MQIRNPKKTGVLLSYLNTGLSMLVSLCYTPIMLRLLGTSQHGVYNAAASVISYLGLLTLGFGSAYMRFYMRYKTKKDEEGLAKLNGLFFMVFALAGSVGLLCGLTLSAFPELVFGSKFLPEELRTSQILLVIMSFNFLFSLIGSVPSMFLTAMEKFPFQRILEIATLLLKPVVTIPLLLMGYGAVGLTIVSTLVTILGLVLELVYARRLGLRFRFGKPDMALLKEISVFSFFVFLSSLATTIDGTIDKLLLSRFVGASAVSVYEIGAKFRDYFMQLTVTVSVVFVPQVNRMVANNEGDSALSLLMARIGRIQFMLLSYVLGGMILVGRYFIRIYAGEAYDDSYSIALLLMIGPLIPYIQNIGLEIQKAKNMHIFRSVAYLVFAVFNIVFSIPCIRYFGTKGAAVGTAIVLFLGNGLVMNYFYHKKVGMDMKYFWKQLSKPIFVYLIILLPWLIISRIWEVNSIPSMLIIAVGYSCTYLPIIWKKVMRQDEREQCIQMLPKFLRRKKTVVNE